MKRIFMCSLVALLGMATISCDREVGPNVIEGVDGINGKTILSGKGEPSTSLGTVGDFYLDLNNYNLYGPKSEQGWGNPISLIGAKGDAGKDGADGQNGADGRDGKDGIDGKDAPKVWTGETVPSSSIGDEGDFYLDLKNKILYGPKTNGSWGAGMSLEITHPFLRENYTISRDGKTLLHWFNKQTVFLDMESDAELRNVEILGGNAFSYSEISEIILPNGLKTIGRGAFYEAYLTSIELPKSLTEIRQGAFVRNRLTSVSIPSGVTKIERYAFSENRLSSLSLSPNIKVIEEFAFRDNRLEELTIPNRVTNIERYAFYGNSLSSITIPRSVVNIGDYAFYDNTGLLKTVVMESPTPPTLGINAFGYDSELRIYVPESSVNIYKNHPSWSRYSSYIFAR